MRTRNQRRLASAKALEITNALGLQEQTPSDLSLTNKQVSFASSS